MARFTAVKDSGKRRSFGTGSVRDVSDGKGRFDLVSPFALTRLAQHYQNGAKKYGDRNWELGQPIGAYLDSALRHGNAFLAGDKSEDHLAALAWNAFSAMHTQEMVERGVLPASLLEGLGNYGG